MDIHLFWPGRQPNTQPVWFLSDLITRASIGNRSIPFTTENWKKLVILSSYLWKPEHAHVISTPLLGYSCLETWALWKSWGAVSCELCVVRDYSLLLASRPPWLLLTFQTYFSTLWTHLQDIINLTYTFESQSSFLLLSTKNVNQRQW